MDNGAKPHIATNPRRSDKRYLVKQFNSRLKGMLQNSWQRFKGLAKEDDDRFLGIDRDARDCAVSAATEQARTTAKNRGLQVLTVKICARRYRYIRI